MGEIPTTQIMALLLGALAAGIPAYLANRNAPSRVVIETAKIVDASGGVLTTMQTLINRLNDELDDARADAQGARTEARAAWEAAESCRRRTIALERALHQAGIDPATV